MGQSTAKLGDKIVAVDTHIFMIPAPLPIGKVVVAGAPKVLIG